MSSPQPNSRADDLIDRFIAAADQDRFPLLVDLERLDGSEKAVAHERLRHELDTRFAARSDFAAPSPGGAAGVRAWLLSAIRVTAPRAANLVPVFTELTQPAQEPSEMVRYWALVNLHQVAAHEALEMARVLRDESVLMHTLSQVLMAAHGDRQALDRVREVLHDWHRDPQAGWRVLRALRLIPVAEVALDIQELLMDLLKGGADEPEHGNALAYDALLALAATGQGSMLASLPPDEIARLVVMATHGAQRHHMETLAGALGRLEPSARTIIVRALTDSRELSPEGRAILRNAGIVAPLRLPAGADRLELAYYLVLRNPAKFEILENFNPAEIRQMAESLVELNSSPDALSEILARLRQQHRAPGVLWRTWVATTQPVRLTQE